MIQNEKYQLLFYIIIPIFILAVFAMWFIIKSADKFFSEADKIEVMIRNDEPKDVVINAIYRLKEKSFHRQTGSRCTELAKMAEVKYNVSILKK